MMRCLSCDIKLMPRDRKPRRGFRVHKGRGLCSRCHEWNKRHGFLDQFPPIRSFEFFKANVEKLKSLDVDPNRWAARLGTTNVALTARLYRNGMTEEANIINRIVKEERREIVPVPRQPCLNCHYPLVQAHTHKAPEGFMSHRGRGLCSTCYDLHKRNGTLEDYPPVRSPKNFMENIEFLLKTNVEYSNWAPRLDTTNVALSRRLYRAGKKEHAAAIERLVKQKQNG